MSTVRKDHKYFMFVEKRPRKWQVGRKCKGYNGISGWCWMAEPAFFISNILDYLLNQTRSHPVQKFEVRWFRRASEGLDLAEKKLWCFWFEIIFFSEFGLYVPIFGWNMFEENNLCQGKIFLGNWKFQIFCNFLVRSGTSTHKNKQKVHILPTVSF